MKAPKRIESPRLLFVRPALADAVEILSRYASDPEVTRFVGFRRHESLNETREFLSWSDAEWERWPAGPYLVRSRADNLLLGSTGLSFETPTRAMTGYLFARDAWGKGYATESLRMMSQAAASAGVKRLYALCHTGHDRSWRVLEKGGFVREGILRKYMEFPNLAPGEPADVYCYALIL